jgi:hypothetical protein
MKSYKKWCETVKPAWLYDNLAQIIYTKLARKWGGKPAGYFTDTFLTSAGITEEEKQQAKSLGIIKMNSHGLYELTDFQKTD